ncbi:MAG: ATP-binding cassette domain-containing protein, partial [Alphaproteobacteria bacterium]|nr:ATP-binding cassette domain-containing protein [Alphaproteobacteria bacterium]
MSAAPVLDVADLRVTIPVAAGPLQAVRGIDIALARGETLCLVGESGCGKSMTALALMGLEPPAARRTTERLTLLGKDAADR